MSTYQMHLQNNIAHKYNLKFEKYVHLKSKPVNWARPISTDLLRVRPALGWLPLQRPFGVKIGGSAQPLTR